MFVGPPLLKLFFCLSLETKVQYSWYLVVFYVSSAMKSIGSCHVCRKNVKMSQNTVLPYRYLASLSHVDVN